MDHATIVKKQHLKLIPLIMLNPKVDEKVFVVADERFAMAPQVWTEKDKQAFLGVRARQAANTGAGTFEEAYDQLEAAFAASDKIYAVTPMEVCDAGLKIEVTHCMRELELEKTRGGSYDLMRLTADYHMRLEMALRIAFPEGTAIDLHFIEKGETKILAHNVLDGFADEDAEDHVVRIINETWHDTQWGRFITRRGHKLKPGSKWHPTREAGDNLSIYDGVSTYYSDFDSLDEAKWDFRRAYDHRGEECGVHCTLRVLEDNRTMEFVCDPEDND